MSSTVSQADVVRRQRRHRQREVRRAAAGDEPAAAGEVPAGRPAAPAVERPSIARAANAAEPRPRVERPVAAVEHELQRAPRQRLLGDAAVGDEADV